tara:strand:- start:1253 stop:2521 length:1269 start_codon:yes stop_codon:yes gene_type:complete
MYILDYKINAKLYGVRDSLLREFLEYLKENYVNVTNHKQDLAKKVVSSFILNSYYPSLTGRDKFGITLDESNYSRSVIVNGKDTKRKISYTYTLSLFDFLQMKGYVEMFKGGVTDYGFVHGKWQPTEKENSFIVMQEKLLNLYATVSGVTKSKKDNVLIVRDENGIDITFRMNEKLRTAKTCTDRYNELSCNSEVYFEGSKRDVQTHKVYLGKTYNKGGRNHMSGEGIQHLSSEDRKKVTINGNPTVVYDYGSYEPSLAYSMCGEVMPEDPYQIELDGYDPKTLRSIAKKCFIIMLNIRSKTTLKNTCNQMIEREFDVEELTAKGKVPQRIDVLTICNVLEEKNYLIKEMFYGNSDKETCHAGSLVCDYITDYFAQRGILVLSVFDEFIIEEQHEETLVRVMREGYNWVMGSNKNVRIKKEK